MVKISYAGQSQQAQKVGIYFGTFAPFHKGHYQEVIKAMSDNDKVLVIVDGFKGDRGDLAGLPLSKRIRLVKEAFVDEPDVIVTSVDEGHEDPDPKKWLIPDYPDGWTAWMDLIVNKVVSYFPLLNKGKVDTAFTWYVGEPEYKRELDERLKKYDGNHKVVLSDRSEFDISATKIRNNPIEHYNFITKPFRRHFVKKVVFIGGPSTGKTTLLRRIANTFGSDYSFETARPYEENSGIGDDDLTATDYKHFILDQYAENSTVINHSNNGLVFLDTDAIATRVYSRLYLSQADNDYLDPFFNDAIAHEEIDLIIATQPTGKFVLDGSRTADWANDGWKFTNELKKQLEELGLEKKVVWLNPIKDVSDSISSFTFYDRYHQALLAIEKVTGYKAGHLTHSL